MEDEEEEEEEEEEEGEEGEEEAEAQSEAGRCRIQNAWELPSGSQLQTGARNHETTTTAPTCHNCQFSLKLIVSQSLCQRQRCRLKLYMNHCAPWH